MPEISTFAAVTWLVAFAFVTWRLLRGVLGHRTALSTNSLGGVTPLSLQARYAAAEGVVGQFYLAILVARLVGLQMSQAAGRSR